MSQQQSEDKYFEKKAEDLLSKLLSEHRDAEDMEKVIYFAMKEVARDQRYSC